MRAVNLLPADLRGAVKAPAPVNPAPEDKGSGAGAYIALGALALCVLGLAGHVLTTNDIKQHQSDLEAAEARVAVVQREVAQLKPYADFASMAAGRIATVNELAAQRFDWENALRDLARALPEDVSVQELSGSISSQGGGSNPLRGALNVPAIEVAGCTSDQPAVARAMSRLRAVDGVTRVSLATSTKAEQQDVPAADAASVDEVTGCEGAGKSDPTDFNVVVFFENDAAKAAEPSAPAPGGSAAGAAGSAEKAAAASEGGETPAAGGDDSASPTTEASGTSVPTSTEAN
jgi:Tfp pilus assembly protein PilN